MSKNKNNNKGMTSKEAGNQVKGAIESVKKELGTGEMDVSEVINSGKPRGKK